MYSFSYLEPAGSQREELRLGQRSWGRRLSIRKGGIEPQESPWKFSSIYPPKPESAYFTALCSHLHLWLYRGLSPTTISLLNRSFRPHVIVQSLPTVRCMRCSKLSKYRFLWAVKDWLEIVLVKGFSLVGPMFAAKFPYPLPAVSLAVYWLI